MTVYDSVERGAADECKPLTGRRPRTFTLTQLLVACVAVCGCTLAATTVVNNNNNAQLGNEHFYSGIPRNKKLFELQGCNAKIKLKIREFQSISAELGETPARQGRVLLGGKRTTRRKEEDKRREERERRERERDAMYSCRCLSFEENANLLAECKTELAIHDECLALKRNAIKG